MIRRIATAAALGVMTLSAGACNTIDGAGEDIESVADEVDEEV